MSRAHLLGISEESLRGIMKTQKLLFLRKYHDMGGSQAYIGHLQLNQEPGSVLRGLLLGILGDRIIRVEDKRIGLTQDMSLWAYEEKSGLDVQLHSLINWGELTESQARFVAEIDQLLYEAGFRTTRLEQPDDSTILPEALIAK